MSAAITSKNKVMHTCTPWTVVCRSSLMSLIMTFMVEPAKLQMNWDSASGISILRSDPVMTRCPVAVVMTAARSVGRPSEPAIVPYATQQAPRVWPSLGRRSWHDNTAVEGPPSASCARCAHLPVAAACCEPLALM
jgi:hypothetical protein